MKQSKKPNIAIRAACVLLCLVLLSAHFTTGLYARYVTGAAGSDQGRIAAFRVSAVMEKTEEDAFSVGLRNGSETAVRYSITVESTEPGMFSAIQLKGKSIVPDDSGKAVFPNLGRLESGGEEQLSLKLTVDPAYAGSDAGSKLLDFSNDSISAAETELPFTVTVSYEQIN